jgi:cyanate permease
VEQQRPEHARVATGGSFALNGAAFASLISRTPAIRDTLGLSTAGMGLLLLCLSVGAVSALPLSGPLVHRVGATRGVAAGGVAAVLGISGAAIGLLVGSAPVTGAGLLLYGAGTGVWDVSMNVEGAEVERRLGRVLMPRFHAGFSLGTVGGAGVGAGAAAAGVAVPAQLLVTAVVVGLLAGLALRWFLPAGPAEAAEQRRARARVLDAWREPRTLKVGLLVLAFALTEGVANDWLALALVDGHGTAEWVGALGFGAFVTAMTVARLVGGSALERAGRVTTLRLSTAVAAAGVLLVVLGGPLVVVGLGALLWGAGAALGFPVGMSAAADDPDRAAVRVSVVSSIGYTAFLAGPPLVGFLAEAAGVLRALLVVLLALAVALLTAGSVAPLRPAPTGTPDGEGLPAERGGLGRPGEIC